MKTIQTWITVLTIAFVCLPALASPRGGRNQAIHYLDRESEHEKLSVGVYYHYRQRDVAIDGSGIAGELEENRFVGHAGYDLLHWLTVYGIAGWNDADIGRAVSSKDSNANLVLGASVGMDLFSHEIQDTVVMEDKFRINASASIFSTEFEASGKDRDYVEFDAKLTFSLVNDLSGNKYYVPESIALFVGPIYNDLVSGDVDETGDRFGVTAGLEFFSVERVSVSFRIEQFDETGFIGGLNIHF